MRREEISKLLLPKGFYVIVKRFSSKEENKRVVAYVITPEDINSDFFGLENHWNVFHYDKKGIVYNINGGNQVDNHKLVLKVFKELKKIKK